MRFALVASRVTRTNRALAEARDGAACWEQMTPADALATLRSGDVALGRIDVTPTLDGIEDGLWALGALAARGVVVLNDPAALLAMHDKLLTARLLRRVGLRHPATLHLRPGGAVSGVRTPVVVKPRFGSGGMDVSRCGDRSALEAELERIRELPWYVAHGALVQELVPPQGYDLRILVAGDRVAGAVFRVAAPGEWRTNIALGGRRRAAFDPPQAACRLALAAAEASGAALVGVDLLPTQDRGWVVVELNGAVEFSRDYLHGADVFAKVSDELARVGAEATCDAVSTSVM
jgi:RimK family alpha-L-glutamate ligase